MASGTLLASALFSLVTGSLYVYVGRVVAERHTAGPSALAARLFVVWWAALAGISFFGAATSFAAIAGFTDLAIFETLTIAALLVLSLALWALLYYLVYLYTGLRGAILPLSIYYAVLYLALLVIVFQAAPDGVLVDRWSVTLHYANPMSGAISLVALLAFVLPQVIAAILYLSLVRKVDEPAQRYRVVMVSVAIFVWFGSSILARAGGFALSDAWQVASRIVSALAALAILSAYRPPAWVRERLRARALAKETNRTTSFAPDEPRT